jgi:hypothetical protein
MSLINFYVATLVPMATLSVAGGLFWGVLIEAGNMTLAQRLKFVTLNVLSNLVSAILWPVVWPQFVCGENATYIFNECIVKPAAAPRAASKAE